MWKSSKNKLKGFSKSQSKNLKNEEYYKCLYGGKYQIECDYSISYIIYNYIVRSLDHETYLQRIRKSTLSVFDDKRCYISSIENIPWE